MTMKRTAVVVLSLVVGFGIYGWAQVGPAPSVPPGVVSGADIGFRVERTDGNTAIGRLMVRVNGKWVDAQFTAAPGKISPVQVK
jgi:hypothetical protein